MGPYRGTAGTRPYAGAGWYYAEYRPRVSAEFIAQLAGHLGWKRQDRVLDLGAGPAQLALRVAPLVAEVVAVDPEPDMLSEGERRVRAAGLRNLTFILASSDDLPALGPTLGMFAAALMGSSFHWMLAKDRVLRDLAALTDPVRGAVAFISCDNLTTPEPLSSALKTLHAILERHLVGIPPGPHPRGRHDPFEVLLARSPFARVETIERVYELRLRPSVEALIGAEYSMSHVLARLGERRAGFEQEARAALAGLEAAGEVVVVRRDYALVGIKNNLV
jgi:SAM-dependent methyltransferase